MSRRCDREGVAWPREEFAPPHDVTHWIGLMRRVERDRPREAMERTRGELSLHLRERPVLP